MYRIALLLLIPMGLGLAGGCSQGPLRLTLTVNGQSATFIYDVQPDGAMKITAGQGMDPESDRPVYTTTLDKDAMSRLAKAVSGSGFLLDSRQHIGSSPESQMVVQASLGLLDNRLSVHSAYVNSVGKIVAALNNEIPSKFQIPYKPNMFTKEPADPFDCGL